VGVGANTFSCIPLTCSHAVLVSKSGLKGNEPVIVIGIRPTYSFADALLDVSDLVRRPVARGKPFVECDLDSTTITG
jgi:hypothetical protein